MRFTRARAIVNNRAIQLGSSHLNETFASQIVDREAGGASEKAKIRKLNDWVLLLVELPALSDLRLRVNVKWKHRRHYTVRQMMFHSTKLRKDNFKSRYGITVKLLPVASLRQDWSQVLTPFEMDVSAQIP